MNKSVEGVLHHPEALTVDNIEVLVAEFFNDKIAVLNLDLHYLIGKGMLECPCDVKTDLNKIFVVDKNSFHNVHVFSKSADLLYSMICVKSGTVSDTFMCLDQFSNILFINEYANSIQIFTSEGELIHSIQCEGFPRGIAVTNNKLLCVLLMIQLYSINVDDSVIFY